MIKTAAPHSADKVLRFWTCMVAAALCLLAVAAGARCADPSGGDTASATGLVVLTDPWDMPVALNMIPAGTPTLLFVCNPSERISREGAVFFDSRRERIEARKVKPVCVLVGSREAARGGASRMDLSIPVYVDSGRAMATKVIGQEIMPALVLLDGKGNLVKVIPGGGEALDNNIEAMLDARPGGHRLIYAILIVLAAAGTLLLVVG